MPNLYKRGETWWARFKVRGIEYRRSLHTAVRAEAERRLKAYRQQIEGEARFGMVAPRSFADAADSWERHATRDLSHKTVKRYLISLKQCWDHLAAKPVHTIDAALLRDLVKARRVMGATTATIRRDLTAISAVLRHAADEDWMEDVNPTLAVRSRRNMREKRDPIALPRDEDIARVMEAAPPRFRDAIEFARETGMRLEEIFGLTWKQLSGGEITITGKRNKRRVIPLSRRVRRIIDRQPQKLGSPWVFRHSDGKERWSSPSARFGDISRRVARRAQKAAQDFHPFRFHDLRHLFAVEYLRAKRGTLYDLQMLLGHDRVTTTEIYLEHLTPDQRLAAMHGRAHKVAHG
jgi:integrase/recombinase XerD